MSCPGLQPGQSRMAVSPAARTLPYQNNGTHSLRVLDLRIAVPGNLVSSPSKPQSPCRPHTCQTIISRILPQEEGTSSYQGPNTVKPSIDSGIARTSQYLLVFPLLTGPPFMSRSPHYSQATIPLGKSYHCWKHPSLSGRTAPLHHSRDTIFPVVYVNGTSWHGALSVSVSVTVGPPVVLGLP